MTTRNESPRDPVILGSLWMVGLSLVLVFVPLVNGLVGGLVGGYRVGSLKRALIAAILPALIVALALWLLLALFDAPLWGLAAGFAGAVVILLSDVGIFVGAAIGGLMAESRRRRLHA